MITRLCKDCLDGACIEVCPVDCILEHAPPERASELPNQLYIDPDQCIDCGNCAPACPWEAISHQDDVPVAFEADVALNALTVARPAEFRPATLKSIEGRRRIGGDADDDG